MMTFKTLLVLIWFTSMAHASLVHATDSCQADVSSLSFTTLNGSKLIRTTCSCDNPSPAGETESFSSNPSVVKVIPEGTFSSTPELYVASPVAAGETSIDFTWRCPNAAGTDYQTTGEFSVSVDIQLAASNTHGNTPYAGWTSDPVSTFSGEFVKQFAPDLALGGPMSLNFSRYYATMLSGDGLVGGALGDNWRHNYQWTLSNDGSSATIISNLGARIEFTKSGALWAPTGITRIKYQLVENSSTGTFTLLHTSSQRLYAFSADGLLTSISDGRGNQHTLSYNSAQQLTEVNDGVGRSLAITYSGGHIATVSDGSRNVTFTYSGNNLATSTSTLGLVTTYAYDAGGLMTGYALPLGNTRFTQAFDGNGRVSSQTDALANKTTLDYVGASTTIIDPLNERVIHTHSSSGDLEQVNDAAGKIVQIGSSATGQRNAITDRQGKSTSYGLDAVSGLPASRINADGTSRSYSYTSRTVNGLTMRDLTSITHEDGSTETFAYDNNGTPVTHTDRAGNDASFSYNSAGQLLNSTNAAGGVFTNTYNADLTLASSRDQAGNTSTFSYDAAKRLILVAHADASSRSFNYDGADQLLAIVDENGNGRNFAYDDNGNMIRVSDAQNNSLTFDYDALDRLVTVTDALGNAATRVYDALGRPSTYTDANGNTADFAYDTRGRLSTWTDSDGAVWSTAHSDEDILTSITDPLGNSIRFTADAMGRFKQIISPLGNTLSLARDTMGRITEITDALGNGTIYSYDSRGLISAISLPAGVATVNFQRNALGRITSLTDPEGNTWQRSYDNSGRQISHTDPLGNQLAISFDSRNRPSVVTFPGGMGSVAYGYDPTGNLIEKSFSDGAMFHYVYDANNRLLDADGMARSRDATGRISVSNDIGIVRDAVGNVTAMTFAAGKTIHYSYNANDQVTRITDWVGGATTFSYDAAGSLIGITRPNGVDTVQTWNADRRLIGIAAGGISNISLVRNGKGQIVTATRNLPTQSSAAAVPDTSSSFDSANQVSNSSYDAMGRLTSNGNGNVSLAWNLASQLISYTAAGITTTASYDALNRRISRTANGVTRNFVWNDALKLASISIEREAATDRRYYVHTPQGGLLYSIDASNNTRRYYHFDEIGNTRFLTDDSGSVVASYGYTPYGTITASTGVLDNPFTWRGRTGAMDEGSGLYYLRARYYDSATGRFISRDPIKLVDPMGVNPYQYGLSNPARYLDPLGLYSEAEFDQLQQNDLQDTLDFINGRIEHIEPYTDLETGRRMMESYQKWKKEVEARLAAFQLEVETRNNSVGKYMSETQTIDCTPKPTGLPSGPLPAGTTPTSPNPGSGGTDTSGSSMMGDGSMGSQPAAGTPSTPGEGSGVRPESPSVVKETILTAVGEGAAVLAGGPVPTDLPAVVGQLGDTVNKLGDQNRRARRLGINVDDYRCTQRQFQQEVAKASDSTIVNLFRLSFDEWVEAYTW